MLQLGVELFWFAAPDGPEPPPPRGFPDGGIAAGLLLDFFSLAHCPEDLDVCFRVASQDCCCDLHCRDDACAAREEDDAVHCAEACGDVEADVRASQPDVLADAQTTQIRRHFSAPDGADVEAQRSIGGIVSG